MKLDFARISSQSSKWTDPKFIITLTSAILVAVANVFNLDLPIEIIIGMLTFIVGLIFKKESATV